MRALENKVALVTGSVQGLGEGIARRLASEGANLVIHALPSEHEKGRAVVNDIAALGADAIFVGADIRDKGQCIALVQATTKHYGRLDILVNNAQMVPPLRTSEQDCDADMDTALHSGLHASLWLSQAAFPWLCQAGGGSIVNFSSINGMYGSKYSLAYNVTKQAIQGLTRTLANEWGWYGIKVNAVMPSGLSPSFRAFYKDDPQKFAAVAKLNPMRRHGRPEQDIGAAVLGLVGDTGSYMSGQTVFVDGGANLMGLPQMLDM